MKTKWGAKIENRGKKMSNIRNERREGWRSERRRRRRDNSRWSGGLISCWSSPGAARPLLGLTLCLGARAPLEMHGPCQRPGAPSHPAETAPEFCTTSACRGHSSQSAQSQVYARLRPRACPMLRRNFCNSITKCSLLLPPCTVSAFKSALTRWKSTAASNPCSIIKSPAPTAWYLPLNTIYNFNRLGPSLQLIWYHFTVESTVIFATRPLQRLLW